MYLKSISIKNFRKLTDVSCSLNPGLNLIVGPNDSGKTALIDAIRLVLKQIVDDYTRIVIEDFNDPTKEISVEMTFSFSGKEKVKEAALFAEYLSFNSENEPELNIWYSIKGDEKNIRFPQFKSGPSKEFSVDMDARCRENLKIVYLRPLRDAEYELKAKPGSRVSKILKQHKDVKDGQSVLVESLKAFKESLEGFFDDGGGKTVKESIHELIGSFDEQKHVSQKTVKLSPTEFHPEKSELNFTRVLEKIALYYDEMLLKPGLGTMNMIFIAAELLHIDTQEALKLILIEEIEAHLHSQRQLKIIKSLQDKSRQGVQMILTTHSPNLASVVDVERLILCCDGCFYSLAKEETLLESKNYSYLKRFLDVTKANLFFAQSILLVEGPTEQLLVPEFTRILGYSNFTECGVSVISTNGLGFEHFVNIFKRKNSPKNPVRIAVITDSDKKNSSEIKEYKQNLEDIDNNIRCYVSKPLYEEDSTFEDTEDVKKIPKKSTTFERIILEKAEVLKRIYIDSFNAIRRRQPPLSPDDGVDALYARIEGEKAPVAQEVAQRLAELQPSDPDFPLIKVEIENYLAYIHNAIKFVISGETEVVTEEVTVTE